MGRWELKGWMLAEWKKYRNGNWHCDKDFFYSKTAAAADGNCHTHINIVQGLDLMWVIRECGSRVSQVIRALFCRICIVWRCWLLHSNSQRPVDAVEEDEKNVARSNCCESVEVTNFRPSILYSARALCQSLYIN